MPRTRCCRVLGTGRLGFFASRWMPGPQTTTTMVTSSTYFFSMALIEFRMASWYSGSCRLIW